MLRKILIASAAIVAMGSTAYAADLPTTKGPAVYTPPPVPFSWTGVYVGGQLGYEWGRTYTNAFIFGAPFATFPAYTPDGVVGGAHLGYNYQVGQFVVGVEGDADGSSFRGSSTAFGIIKYGSKEPIDGSVRGRVGYAWDRALIYATGGVAFGDFNNFESNTIPFAYNDSHWSTRVGWTAGAGIEYAIDNNWSCVANIATRALVPTLTPVAAGAL